MFDLSVITATDTVILDTDVGTDCDDAAALALLFVNCKTVGATPAAVINDTANRYYVAFDGVAGKEAVRLRINDILKTKP